ncbi:MAG: DUF6484 domain-containing protein [Myxococcales bacterium]|nr:DUF6484 domain-containing protein [Myxococcales bacterium]
MSKTSRVSTLVRPALEQASSDGAPALPSARSGRIVKWNHAGLWVDCYEGSDGPAVARSLVAWQPERLQQAVRERRQVLLLFEDGDRRRPVIIGAIEEVPEPPGDVEAQREPQGLAPAPRPSLEASVDGRRVLLEANDEVVLRCGEASITLRRNGRVLIRGAYVETRSRGTNRIKGGNVLIN